MKELGIILDENGNYMSFGKWKPIDKRGNKDSIDWHNESFLHEVYKTKWFKKLNIPYIIDNDTHFQNQLDVFARCGKVVIVNIKEGTNKPGESSFIIVIPSTITNEQIDFFMRNEEKFKSHGKDLFALIDIFNVQEEYDIIAHFYNIDDLYNYLYSLKKKNKQKIISLR